MKLECVLTCYVIMDLQSGKQKTHLTSEIHQNIENLIKLTYLTSQMNENE